MMWDELWGQIWEEFGVGKEYDKNILCEIIKE